MLDCHYDLMLDCYYAVSHNEVSMSSAQLDWQVYPKVADIGSALVAGLGSGFDYNC